MPVCSNNALATPWTSFSIPINMVPSRPLHFHATFSPKQVNRILRTSLHLFIHPLPGLVPGLRLHRPFTLSSGSSQISSTCKCDHGPLTKLSILCYRSRWRLPILSTGTWNSTGWSAEFIPLHYLSLCPHIRPVLLFPGNFRLGHFLARILLWMWNTQMTQV